MNIALNFELNLIPKKDNLFIKRIFDLNKLFFRIYFQAAFRCSAVANPPVYEYSYKWFIDSTQVLGQSGYYFEIFNVTRSYHDKQVRCSVENNLGVAMGLKSI